MSAQVALLAATTAMTAFSQIQAGSAQARGYEGAAGQSMLQGGQADVQQSQVRLQAAQEELQRRKGLARLMSANRADVAGRGIDAGQGSSADVIDDYNRSQAEEDINNIRFIGESRSKMLSFAKQQYEQQASSYLNMASMARTQGWLGAARSIGMSALQYFGLPKFGGGSTGGTGPISGSQASFDISGGIV